MRSHSSRRSASNASACIERRVGGGAALGRGIPDMPGPRLEQLLGEGLEQLHEVDLAAPQGSRIAPID